jgi:hypothetical protein
MPAMYCRDASTAATAVIIETLSPMTADISSGQLTNLLLAFLPLSGGFIFERYEIEQQRDLKTDMRLISVIHTQYSFTLPDHSLEILA